MRKSPAFALTAIFTIALGVGATTAIYTLIHQVMMRELPVDHPEQLWKIGKEDECCNDGGLQGDWRIFSYDLYNYFRDNTPGFQSLAAFQAGQTGFNVRRAGDKSPVEPITGRYVSGNYFSTLGVPVLVGRAISAEDDRDGSPAVAVVSYRLWQRKFGLDRALIGSTLMLNGKAVTVVGVTAPAFYGEQLNNDPPEMWLPLHQEPVLTTTWTLLKNPQRNWLDLIGRVRPGTHPQQIEAQLRVELRQWLQTQAGQFRPDERAQFGQQTTELASAASGVNIIRDRYQSGLHMLFAVAGIVLLIACANVANLMLVRGMNRRQETAVRAALGASRRKLVSQMLVESIVLSVIGGFVALFFSIAAARLIIALVFRDAKFVPIDAHPSLPVLGFTFLVAVATGILFGCAPAWLASHTQPAEALRGNARSTKGGSTLPQKVLIIVQAGLSVVLLCCAGWLALSLRNLWHQHYGFDSDSVMVVSVDPALAGYKVAQLPMLYQRIHEKLRAIPGAEGDSYAMYTPMSHDNWSNDVAIPGQPPPDPNSTWYNASWLRIGPDYFKTLGAKLISGRPILDTDTEQAQRVA
ncbi:MAG TPA: ABC transporter permease, partial [Terriglobales bacterium]